MDELVLELPSCDYNDLHSKARVLRPADLQGLQADPRWEGWVLKDIPKGGWAPLFQRTTLSGDEIAQIRQVFFSVLKHIVDSFCPLGVHTVEGVGAAFQEHWSNRFAEDSGSAALTHCMSSTFTRPEIQENTFHTFGWFLTAFLEELRYIQDRSSPESLRRYLEAVMRFDPSTLHFGSEPRRGRRRTVASSFSEMDSQMLHCFTLLAEHLNRGLKLRSLSRAALVPRLEIRFPELADEELLDILTRHEFSLTLCVEFTKPLSPKGVALLANTKRQCFPNALATKIPVNFSADVLKCLLNAYLADWPDAASAGGYRALLEGPSAGGRAAFESAPWGFAQAFELTYPVAPSHSNSVSTPLLRPVDMALLFGQDLATETMLSQLGKALQRNEGREFTRRLVFGTLVHMACAGGRKAMEALLESADTSLGKKLITPEFFAAEDHLGRQPLWIAVCRCDVFCVESLLAHGALVSGATIRHFSLINDEHRSCISYRKGKVQQAPVIKVAVLNADRQLRVFWSCWEQVRVGRDVADGRTLAGILDRLLAQPQRLLLSAKTHHAFLRYLHFRWRRAVAAWDLLHSTSPQDSPKGHYTTPSGISGGEPLGPCIDPYAIASLVVPSLLAPTVTSVVGTAMSTGLEPDTTRETAAFRRRMLLLGLFAWELSRIVEVKVEWVRERSGEQVLNGLTELEELEYSTVRELIDDRVYVLAGWAQSVVDAEMSAAELAQKIEDDAKVTYWPIPRLGPFGVVRTDLPLSFSRCDCCSLSGTATNSVTLSMGATLHANQSMASSFGDGAEFEAVLVLPLTQCGHLVEYTVELSPQSLGPPFSALSTLKGRISPLSPLSLPPEARAAANIPPTAKHFAFAYPIRGFTSEWDDIDQGNPRHWFFAMGGYLYFDTCPLPTTGPLLDPLCFGAYTLLQVNALKSVGKSFYFDGPFTLPMHICEELGPRWQPVTLPALRHVGTREFCWVMPGESFGGIKVDPSRPIPHGAFAYKFRDPKQNCYFALTKLPPEPRKHGRKWWRALLPLELLWAKALAPRHPLAQLVEAELQLLNSLRNRTEECLSTLDRLQAAYGVEDFGEVQKWSSSNSLADRAKGHYEEQQAEQEEEQRLTAQFEQSSPMTPRGKSQSWATDGDGIPSLEDLVSERWLHIKHIGCTQSLRSIRKLQRCIAKSPGAQWAQMTTNLPMLQFAASVVFLIVFVLSVAFGPATAAPNEAYFLRSVVENQLARDTNLAEVASVDSMWEFLAQRLLPVVLPNSTAPPSSSTPPALAGTAAPFGLIRLRQVRVRGTACRQTHFPKATTGVCYPPLRATTVATASDWSFAATNNTTASLTSRYRQGGRNPGFIGRYPSAGFTVELPAEREAAQAAVAWLQGNRWVDRGTRLVTVGFSLWDAGVDRFVAVTVSFEVTAVGGVLPAWDIALVKLTLTGDWHDRFGLALDSLVFLFTLYLVAALSIRLWRIILQHAARPELPWFRRVPLAILAFVGTEWRVVDVALAVLLVVLDVYKILLWVELRRLERTVRSLAESGAVVGFVDLSEAVWLAKTVRTLLGINLATLLCAFGKFFRDAPFVGMKANSIFRALVDQEVILTVLLWLYVLFVFGAGLRVASGVSSGEFADLPAAFFRTALDDFSQSPLFLGFGYTSSWRYATQSILFVAFIATNLLILNMLIAVVTNVYTREEAFWGEQWLQQALDKALRRKQHRHQHRQEWWRRILRAKESTASVSDEVAADEQRQERTDALLHTPMDLQVLNDNEAADLQAHILPR